jgi:hypothetical protein
VGKGLKEIAMNHWLNRMNAKAFQATKLLLTTLSGMVTLAVILMLES